MQESSISVDLEEERPAIADAYFSVEARLAIQLGRESISSSITAILELVKNAYDAEAQKVRIRFSGLDTNSPMMVVEDDGCGMTKEDLLDHWMVIGTSNKVKLRRSGTKRALTGEKGLGRLGLDRLCKVTTVQTFFKGGTNGIELPIDWTQYEQENVRLENVVLKLFQIPDLSIDPITKLSVPYAHGTRLLLLELKDEWSEKTLIDLRAELSLLVSPFETSDEFQIEIESGMNWTSVDGVVRTPETLLQAAQWKVTASIDDEGIVEMKMVSEHHDLIYQDGPVEWRKRFPGFGEIPICGPLTFEFYYFPRLATTLGGKTISVTTVRTFLDANQGLRIYRDGFRVKPYGNPNGDGDWLKLAFRRTISPQGVAQDKKPGNWRVGYNQVVGAVFVSRDKNNQLLDQTNREGLVDGRAFAALRSFAEEVIRFFELNNQDYEMSLEKRRTLRDEAKEQADESLGATASALERLEEVTQTLNALIQHNELPIGSQSSVNPTLTKDVGTKASLELGAIKNTLEGAKAKLDLSAKMFKEEDERESREKDTMANLASLGILAASFGHETLGWASSCATNAGWLERNLPIYFWFSDPNSEHHIRQKLIDTCKQALRIETFAEFSIGNVKPEKRRRTTFCLKKVILNVLKNFDESLRVQRSIDVGISMPDHSCRIKGYPIDWESVMVNLITNAVWALGEKREEFQRQIRISLKAQGANYLLIFEDNGIGIAAGQEEKIFIPTVSTKRNESGTVSGTGMGLAIVKTFVELNTGGSIVALPSGDLGGASFQICLPAAQDEPEA